VQWTERAQLLHDRLQIARRLRTEATWCKAPQAHDSESQDYIRMQDSCWVHCSHPDKPACGATRTVRQGIPGAVSRSSLSASGIEKLSSGSRKPMSMPKHAAGSSGWIVKKGRMQGAPSVHMLLGHSMNTRRTTSR
jgi:hypothetical protein